MEQVQRVVMVAMKGHPCTGKTTLARSIAAAHKWPLISLDDVFAPHKWRLISLDDASVQSDRQFESMCQIALTQLNLGIRVIIDSPLAQKDQLDRLLQLSASTKARLIVVECKPRDTYEWRQWAENRFEHHDSTGTGQWKQLLTWDDIEPLIEQPDASSDCDAKNFSKLVVDTTRYITKIRDSDLYCALHYLAAYEGTLSVDFSDWEGNTFRSIERGEEGEEKGKEENHQRDVLGHVHRLTVRVDEKQQKCNNEVIRRCRACLGPISGVEYNCDGCDLSVHKYCAELPDKQEISPQNHSPFLRQLPREYAFPERKGSNLCETHKRDFDECSECLFKSTLQSGLLPTVVLHPCHSSSDPLQSIYLKCS